VQLRDIFSRKFASTQFDVIIVTDNDAFAFIKRYRDELFPGIPVVFCGINYLQKSDLEGIRRFTGVNEDADIVAGIDLVLKLHPDTKEIIAITDTSVTGQAVRGELEKVLSGYSHQLSYQILDDITMNDLQDRVSQLKPKTIIFYTFFFRDKNGRVFEFDESAALITGKSSVPVYGAWDFSLGFGIVGGVLTSGYVQGKTAGAIALRILKGEDPETIPVVWHSLSQPMFDYLKISALGIQKHRLPTGSVFILEPPSALSIDKTVVWAVLLGGLFVTGIFIAYVVIQKRSEIQLRASEEKYRTLVSNLHVGVYRATPEPNGRYVQINPALVKILGYASAEELMQTPILHLYENPEDRNNFLDDLMRDGTVRDRELAFRKKDGTSMIAVSTATAICDQQGTLMWIDGVLEDVTEKRNLEKQLRHAQKMEAIGTLAGGVAHDFNNILTAILGYANLIGVSVADNDRIKPYAQRIIEASEKAATLTRSLLAFSRKQVISPKAQNLNDIVTHLYALLQRIIGEDIILRIDIIDKPLMVLADASQIEQVLMNLAANARDAMQHGGRISIETTTAPNTTEARLSADHMPLCGYAVITVSDTGAGMDEKTRLRIFEPFFTTKEVGRGTGLGLSMAYGIIKQHGGEISATSVPEQGTSFRVLLPLISPAIPTD
jgi:PAS domain S-box-containing protein